MASATLSLDISNRVWISEIFREYPDVRIYIEAFLLNDDLSYLVARFESSKPKEIVTWLEQKSNVESVDLFILKDHQATVQLQVFQTIILQTIIGAEIPIIPPIEITENIAYVEFVTTQDRFSNLLPDLHELGVDPQLKEIENAAKGQNEITTLTERQLEVLEIAVGLGYFEVPRKATVEDVAREMNVNKSTASEIIRRGIRDLVVNSEGDLDWT